MPLSVLRWDPSRLRNSFDLDTSSPKSKPKELKELLTSITVDERKAALYRALLAPIGRLSPEILIHIPLLTDAISDLGRKTRSEALILGAVCAYWRTVSQDTPGLWGSLSNGIYPEHVLQFLELHLARSQELQVTLLEEERAIPSMIFSRDVVSDGNHTSKEWLAPANRSLSRRSSSAPSWTTQIAFTPFRFGCKAPGGSLVPYTQESVPGCLHVGAHPRSAE
ncbi:hypothetical protein Moror_9328 [Moniliophthora roreri MCA 2997]|uniref:F-box domain-containing protein n=1 Tax=Moniliophthora roreri (strain MCA 2997) TaxID=1381753 RepID=V2Y3B5_MONRO|nr:hypothetical protein Moror_9328 [Moniliophthora roreri MCA 2997]